MHCARTPYRGSSRRGVYNELRAERPVLLLLWDLGQAPSLSGRLCCKGTSIFQRSLKTDSMHLPQKGFIVLGTAYHADRFLRPRVG